MRRFIPKTHPASQSKRPARTGLGRRSFSAAFTIVELIVVIAVIGILASVTMIAYGGIRGGSNDKSVLTDIDSVDGIETQYAVQSNTQGKVWNSGSGIDTNLQFTPSAGNVIDVSSNGTGYCVKAYNPTAATYKSLATAAQKESQTGACGAAIVPITLTFNYSASVQTFTVPAGVTKVTLQVWGGAGGGCWADMPGWPGYGGYAKGNLAVTGGNVLNITVGYNGSPGYNSYSCPGSDGSNSQVNRPAASALLLGVGGTGGDYDTDGYSGGGYTYAGVTNTATSTGTSSIGKVTVTYTPGV